MALARTGARAAFSFVLVMGVVNLFADMTYEGGAAINGPFLGSLGASAALVGILAGIGEFLGYSLRSVSGYIADRSGRYWPMTFIGYTINLLAVPAMALAGNWQVAALLLILERVGRAIRKPTVEAMLSYSAETLGRGWVYGLNTALDETGATVGPLLMALALYLRATYRGAYGLLLISSLLALVALTVARIVFPVPSRLQRDHPDTGTTGFTRRYWLSMIAAACFGAGLMSYEFISYHLSTRGVFSAPWIPIGVALATVMSIIASLVLGRLYDRRGIGVVLGAIGVAALFSPLVFLGGFTGALVGLLLWGLGYAVQDSLLKAVVAGMLPRGRRNFGFGLFYAAYGVGWLGGSITTGLLYEHSIPGVIIFSVVVQVSAIPLFLLANRSPRELTPAA